MHTKEEYESLINNSPLFGICKEDNPVLYRNYKYMLETALTEYYMQYIMKGKPLEDYSMPLLDAAEECIRSYDSSRGEFLNLLGKVFRQKLMKARAKDKIEEMRGGLGVSEKDDLQIRRIIKFASSKQLDINSTAVQKNIANALNMSFAKVQMLIRMNQDAVLANNRVQDDEGDELDIFETLSDSSASAESISDDTAGVMELLKIINDTFSRLQERQKRLLSMLLTANILKAFDMDTDKAKRYIEGTAFCSEEEIEYCIVHDAVHTRREISNICDVSEQQTSRAYRVFAEKVGSVYYENE